eukprot:CAMPEP_0118853728 /NCGR_PEP_ID=MMETSP1163-20130328/2205_1 /TAXON_ID=124430 /ORGANISM="Phaeomonas parva, Strain CCMP2877" /LENGTH=393 /DNA_ID=CAMNT_0006786327 /DNA_START=9 /DNA_END=1186 /DNA_ORIENTATION=-
MIVQVADQLDATASAETTIVVSPMPEAEGVATALDALEDADPTDTVESFQILAAASAVSRESTDQDSTAQIQEEGFTLLNSSAGYLDKSATSNQAWATAISSLLDAANSDAGDDVGTLPIASDVQNLALDAITNLDDLMLRISNPDPLVFPLTSVAEEAVIKALSVLLRTSMRNVPASVARIQDDVLKVQRVRANSLVAGEAPVRVYSGQIQEATVVHRLSRAMDEYGLDDEVILSQGDLTSFGIYEGLDFMLSTEEYDASLSVYQDDNTTTTYSIPIGETDSYFAATSVRRISLTVAANTSSDIFPPVNTLQNAASDISVVDVDRSPHITQGCLAESFEPLSYLCPSGEAFNYYNCSGFPTSIDAYCQSTEFQCSSYDAQKQAFVEREGCIA